MLVVSPEPIDGDWHLPSRSDRAAASASHVADLLGHVTVAELGPSIRPLLTAAAGELAAVAGIDWPDPDRDADIVLFRLVATIARRNPDATGPCTLRLAAALRTVPVRSAPEEHLRPRR